MRHRTQIRAYPAIGTGQGLAGKFLQLELDGTPWLLLASARAFRYHNQLLAGFLGEQGVAYRWADRETLAYDDRRVLVTGGGRFRLDPAAATLEVWDDSTAYGRFDAGLLMAQLALASSPWSRLTVRTRREPA